MPTTATVKAFEKVTLYVFPALLRPLYAYYCIFYELPTQSFSRFLSVWQRRVSMPDFMPPALQKEKSSFCMKLWFDFKQVACF